MLTRTPISVLIVEDEAIIAQNIQELLFSLDYDAFAIASSSHEALARASERCPNVVLMDIRIKGELDGIATAALLRERFDVPIIYLTAHADAATIERATKTEPYGYLVKPIKPPDLRSAIEVAHYRHSMESRARARERWFSTTMRSIADAVITVDLAGKITFLNPAAELLVGMPAKEAMGRSALEVVRLLDPESLYLHETPLDRVLREKQSVRVPEAVLLGGGGTPDKVIADSAAPVIDGNELLGAVMVLRDVTEHKLLQRQLEMTDRLASLGTMAAGVAHEINNPLSVVMSNGELVLEHLDSVESARDPSATVEDRAQRAAEAVKAQRELLSAVSRVARIVADLKAFSRQEPDVSASSDVRDAIEWAIRSTAHEFRHRARLTTDLKKVPRVAADETRLGQILINLLINAAQAIAPGNLEQNRVSISTRTDAQGRVVIDVTDTGSGIEPEVLTRIFEPFFTTKPAGVGTGLGLSICHGIAASMGGKLEVESRVGEGTTFRLTLPSDTNQEPSLSPPAEFVPPARRGRILLIDDEDMVLNAIARILNEHEIICTQHAAEALARLESDDRFDIIFCDLMMPKMTGIDFYEALLRIRPELARRVVFLSGGAVTTKAARFLETVPNQRIEKPFQVKELRGWVQQILARGAPN